MDIFSKYQVVIGLEVHAQLQTKSKLFSGDSIYFGAEPNTQISPITLAHPGTLPKMNKKAIEYAIKMGLVCNCEIVKDNYFARKNYFYPDLPKGYQISQHTTPICKTGFINIGVDSEMERKIRINRIHLEEDAGKSIHDALDEFTCIDYNRAGTPLIEIVTEPDINSADEVVAYLNELRKLLRYVGVCDGNMEEGSMRCDVNISVKLKEATQLGTRVEVKNLNSIRNAKRAVEYEADRLIKMVENGEVIIQQTRSFDATNNTTFAIRDKEDAEDYRYFPDPDLSPFLISDAFISQIEATIPPLPAERIKKYISEYHLSPYDAKGITEDKDLADYFEQVITHTSKYKAAANCLLGPVKNWINENGGSVLNLKILPTTLAEVIELIESGKISFSMAYSKLFQHLLNNTEESAEVAAKNLNLFIESSVDELEPIIDEVLIRLAAKVLEYKKGKKGLLALFVGEIMKKTKGKADPKITNEILLKKLEK